MAIDSGSLLQPVLAGYHYIHYTSLFSHLGGVLDTSEVLKIKTRVLWILCKLSCSFSLGVLRVKPVDVQSVCSVCVKGLLVPL